MSGNRFEVSTMRYVEASKWSAIAGKVKGNSEEARSINSYLDILKGRVYQYQKELIHEGKKVEVSTFKEKWVGVQERPKLLLKIFNNIMIN